MPPTVAIEQRTSRGGRKSTVATVTEVYHFLRLLFVKLGTQFCPDCNVAIQPQTPRRSSRAARGTIGRSAWNSSRRSFVSRKGYYTDLRSGHRAKGSRTCASTARCSRPAAWPGSTGSRSTPSSCQSARLVLRRPGEGAARAARARRWISARARDRVPHDLDRLGAALAGRGLTGEGATPEMFSTPAARARAAGAASRNSTRGCSRSTRNTAGVPVLRHGPCSFAGFDAEHDGRGGRGGTSGGRARNGPVPPARRRGCAGGPSRVDSFRGAEYRRLSPRCRSRDVERHFRELRLRGGRRRSARDIVAELRSRLGFLREVGLPI